MDGKRTYRYGLEGCADIIGIARGGRFVAIEAKVGDDVQRESQARFASMIERMGGIYILAYSEEEAEEVFNARLEGLEAHPPVTFQRPRAESRQAPRGQGLDDTAAPF